MTKNEVMQMALETLNNMVKVDWREWDEFASVEDFVRWAKSRANFTAEALRAALAQPDEQIDIKGAEMNTNRSGNLHEVMHQAAWDSATRVPEGDIRALKHRIHELEGEVIGYKQILDTQPEQKPVAYLTKRKLSGTEGLLRADMIDMSAKNKETHDFIPLYTAPPPPRKPLSDDELLAALKSVDTYPTSETARLPNGFKLFARAIEAAHGIKEK